MGRLRHLYKVVLRAAIYACLRPPIELFRRLPPPGARRLGEAAGALLYALLWAGMTRARANLRRAFPRIKRREEGRILRNQMRHLGGIFGEYLSLSARPPGELKAMVRMRGFELVSGAVESGRGAVIMTAHFGNWEVAAGMVGLHVPRLAVVARELYDFRLDRLSKQFRRNFNVGTIDTRDARGMIKLLREGGVLGVLADQHSDRVANAPVPFFGALVQTPVGPARLAAHAEAALLMGFMVLEPEGYVLQFEEVQGTAGQPEERMAHYNRRLEQFIRERPEQWLWLHDRWRGASS